MKTANYIQTMRYAVHMVPDEASRAKFEDMAREWACAKAAEMNGELASISHVWGFDETGDTPSYQPYHWKRTDISITIPDQPAEPKSEFA